MTIGWTNGIAAASPVTFSMTDPLGGGWSPSTITLAATGGATASAVLAIPPSESMIAYTFDLTNTDHVLPITPTFNLVSISAQVFER